MDLDPTRWCFRWWSRPSAMRLVLGSSPRHRRRRRHFWSSPTAHWHRKGRTRHPKQSYMENGHLVTQHVATVSRRGPSPALPRTAPLSLWPNAPRLSLRKARKRARRRASFLTGNMGPGKRAIVVAARVSRHGRPYVYLMGSPSVRSMTKSRSSGNATRFLARSSLGFSHLGQNALPLVVAESSPGM